MRAKEAIFELLYADDHISTEEDPIFSGEDGRNLKSYVYGDDDVVCNENKLVRFVRQAGCELIIRKGDKEYKIDGKMLFNPRMEEHNRQIDKWLQEVKK